MSLFSLLLLVFAVFITVYKVLDTPASTQKALDTSGIYDVFVQNTLNQKEQQGEISLKTGDVAQDEIIRGAVQDAFPPAFVQQTAEQGLDHMYDWLHGKTPQLELAVDLKGSKTAFANTIAAQAQIRATGLPVCAGPTPTPTSVEQLLAATCRPAGAPPEMIATIARQLALSSKVFDELALTTSDLKDDKGRPLSDKLKDVPTFHRYYIMSLYIIPVVLALCALAIVSWSATRRGGAKRVAHILLWTGLLSIVWALAVGWGVNRVAEMITKNAEGVAAAVQDSVTRAIGTLAGDLRFWWLVMGAAYVLAAVILFVVIHVMNKRTMHHVEALNKSLGYSDVPSAGTMFDPQKEQQAAPARKPADKLTKDATEPPRPAGSTGKTKDSPK